MSVVKVEIRSRMPSAFGLRSSSGRRGSASAELDARLNDESPPPRSCRRRRLGASTSSPGCDGRSARACRRRRTARSCALAPLREQRLELPSPARRGRSRRGSARRRRGSGRAARAARGESEPTSSPVVRDRHRLVDEQRCAVGGRLCGRGRQDRGLDVASGASTSVRARACRRSSAASSCAGRSARPAAQATTRRASRARRRPARDGLRAAQREIAEQRLCAPRRGTSTGSTSSAGGHGRASCRTRRSATSRGRLVDETQPASDVVASTAQRLVPGRRRSGLDRARRCATGRRRRPERRSRPGIAALASTRRPARHGRAATPTSSSENEDETGAIRPEHVQQRAAKSPLRPLYTHFVKLRDLPSVDELARGARRSARGRAGAGRARARTRGDPRRSRSRRPAERARGRARRGTAPGAAPRPQRDRRARAHEPRPRAARRRPRSSGSSRSAAGYSNLEYDLADRRARLAPGPLAAAAAPAHRRRGGARRQQQRRARSCSRSPRSRKGARCSSRAAS